MKEWTDGRRRSFVTSVIRGGFRRWPPRFDALKLAYRDVQINEATGRSAKHYECNECHKLFPSKSVQVDHIRPVVEPLDGFISWDVFIERLFCDASNLQILCTDCHKKKSAEERKQRKSNGKK